MIIGYSRVFGTPATDPYWSDVKLLMGFEGLDGSITTGFADESSAAHGTASGSPGTFLHISSARRKFGSSSLYLNGNSPYYGDSNDWNFASGQFTVELWIWPTNAANGNYQFLVGQWLSAGNLGWVLYIDASGHLGWNTSTTGSDNNFDITASSTISSSAWHHVAIDFDGSKYRLYADGTMVGSFSTPRTIFDSPDNLTIGSNSNITAYWYYGNMDELRITKGVARYASDGGYTVPTSAFPRSGSGGGGGGSSLSDDELLLLLA
jgi:hypothetical protein